MDPLFKALSLYRRRKFEQSAQICTEELLRNPFDQMQCLTQQIYVDDVEADEEGIAETVLTEDAIAQIARPGTSLKTAAIKTAFSPAVRPVTQTGRPISGIVRPGTQAAGGNESIEAALQAPRTSKTARPMTTASGRFVRLGTASMLSSGPDGPFVNLARLNITKYANNSALSRSLFEYILMHENEVRLALDLAAQATQATQFKDWWWKLQLGKCYYKVGLLRDAESQFKSSLKHPVTTVDPYLWLGKVYIRLDQPLAAMELYKQGMDKFPQEMTLNMARIREALGDQEQAVHLYRNVLRDDAVCVEAIACIAMHHFYSDQPEVALRYYRRILQMNAATPEVYNNLGLCSFYSQQYDVCVTCFEKALLHSDSDETTADIWYNLSHVALGTGDRQLAMQCLKLSVVANNNHSESYNNMGVVECSKNSRSPQNLSQAKTYFEASANTGKHLFEPFFNLALVGEESGQYSFAFENVKTSVKLFPTFYAANQLLNRISKMYESV